MNFNISTLFMDYPLQCGIVYFVIGFSIMYRCIKYNKPFFMLAVFLGTTFVTSMLMIMSIEKYPNNGITIPRTPVEHYYGKYHCPICKSTVDRVSDNITCVQCNKKFHITCL